MLTRKTIIAILSLLTLLPAALEAATYGDREKGQECFVVIIESRNIRDGAGTHNKVVGQVKMNDTIFVARPVILANGNEQWLQVPGQGFILYNDTGVATVPNPHYVEAEEAPRFNKPTRTSSAVGLILTGLFILIGFLNLSRNERYRARFQNFWGAPDANGMKKLFFFSVTPYKNVVLIFITILSVILGSLVSVLAIGGVTWLLFMIIKYLLLAIMWVGIISCVLGIIATLCGVFYGLIPAIIGGLIWSKSDWFENMGASFQDWGERFFSNLNLFSFTWDIFSQWWWLILLIAGTPLILFLVFALFATLNVGFWSGLEWIISTIYGIRNPCPTCGHKLTVWGDRKTRLVFKTGSGEHPVGLHPSWYGVFHHRSPVTGEKLPTMMLNGRDKLTRICPSCNTDIQARSGAERHVAVVGHRAAGKTTLIYKLLKNLQVRYRSVITFTDKNAGDIQGVLSRIPENGEIFTEQTDFERIRAIQVIVKTRLIPYKLHFYDIAGEMFNSTSLDEATKEYISYFRNAQTFLYLIDPFMIDFTDLDSADPEMVAWLAEEHRDKRMKREFYKPQETFDQFTELLRYSMRDKASGIRKLPLNFILVKNDIGYLEHAGIDPSDPEQLKAFVYNTLGLAGIVSQAETTFGQVNFYTVSAYRTFEQSKIDKLRTDLLSQIDLKID